MAHHRFLRIGVPILLLCFTLQCITTRAEQAAAQPAAEVYDVNKELEKLRGWKHWLTGEVDKCKAELEKAQTAHKTEERRATDLAAQAEQLRQAAATAESKATAADARAAAAEARATAAENRATAAEARAAAAEAASSSSSPQVAELTSRLESLRKDADAAAARATAAEAKATAAEARAAAAEGKVSEAEARMAAHTGSSSQLSSQLEAVRQEAARQEARAAAAEAKASASAAAADASHGEAAALRSQLATAVREREALEARVSDLATATAKAGGLRGHALAIYEILLQEALRHRDTAVGYANEKLPGLKAKVAEVHASVSAQVPDVPRHVGAFVGRVDGELRPWLRQQLRAAPLPALRRYAEDPVVLAGLVVAILGAPVLLLLLPLLACVARALRPRPQPATGPSRPAKRGSKKAKQG